MELSLKEKIREARRQSARRYRKYAGRLAEDRAEYFTARRDDPNGVTLAIANETTLGKRFESEAPNGQDVPIGEGDNLGSPFGIPTIAARKQATNANEYKWRFYNLVARDHEELATVVDIIQDHERACLLSARPHPHLNLWQTQKRRWHASERTDGKDGGGLIGSVPGYWRFAELDKVKLPAGLTTRDPRKVIEWIATVFLKNALKGASFVYQFSSSYGIHADDVVSVHIWFRSVQLMDCREWHATSKIIAKDVVGWDAAIAVGTQICFTARPTIIGANGGPTVDHLGDDRVGVWWGDHDDVDLGEILERVKRAEAAQLEQARERARLTHKRASSLSDAAIIRAYVKRWDLIAPQLGDGEGGRGFDRPIFQMLCAAVECGETDRDRCPQYLAEYLARVIARRSLETREKGGKAPSAYLAVEELQRRFDDALKKVWGAGDNDEV